MLRMSMQSIHCVQNKLQSMVLCFDLSVSTVSTYIAFKAMCALIFVSTVSTYAQCLACFDLL